MPGESVKDLVVRMSFEHGDTRQQISAIKNELQMMQAGFAASAAMAATFSGGMNTAGSAVDQLKAKLQAQQQLVDKYGEAIQQANEKLQQSMAKHQEQAERVEQLKQKEQELTQQKQQLVAAMEQEAAANGTSSQAYQQMAQQLDQVEQSLTQTQSAIEQEERALSRSDAAINRNAQSVMRLETERSRAQTAMAQTQQQLTQEEARLRRNAEAWEHAAESARQFGERATSAGQWQQSAGRELTKVSAGIAGIGVASAKAAIDWESSFAGVRKTVNGTEEELQGINDALLDMEVPTDFSELADIAANAGQLGIATENVVGFTRTMADLAETTDLTADAAASSFAQFANITNMPQQNIDRLGSVTVELGNNLATTESKIVAFAQAIGAAGSQVGMTQAEIFGIAGGLSSLGLEAGAGGTAFSKAMVNMKVAVETGSEDLKKYATVAGMTAEQFKASFNQDAAGTFIQFVQGLSSGSQSAIAMLDELGVTETRYRDMLLRASNASTLLTKSVQLANGAWEQNTALANEAAVRYNTTASKMQMVGKQAQRVAMSFGDAILPSVSKGMEGIQGILDKFMQLDDAQRQSIIKWAAYAAAVGPALTVIGKANTAIGSVAQGFSSLASAMASGGVSGLFSQLSSLLGPAGWIAVAAGIGLAAYKLYDYASGAKAAREAQAQLNEQAKQWAETQAQTIYDTGTADPLSRFGLSKEAFTGATKEAEDWMSSLMTVWTDGKGETNKIVKEYTEGFTKGSDDVRAAIEGQGKLLESHGAMTPKAKAQMDADLKQLDAWDKEVGDLLKKRQNGFITDEEQARLNSILKARQALKLKYSLEPEGGYEKIVKGLQSGIERARASGEPVDKTLIGDTMNALAEGRKSYMDALDASYDAEYQQLSLIEDEEARQQALTDLNAKYNEQRQEGEDAYKSAVKEAGAMAFEEGGMTEQISQIDQLIAALGNGGEDINFPKLAELTAGMDEGAMASMLSMIEQLKDAGMSDIELGELGINYDDIMQKVQAIRELTQGVEGLEGLNQMFTESLPEEIQRIMVGLDMTQAAADWAAFAAGGDLAKIKAGVEPEGEGLTVDLTGNVTDIAKAEGLDFEVDGDGKVTSITTKSGLKFTADGDGNITSVTLPSGETIDLSGNVKDITWPEGSEFTYDAEGNITSVTTPDGTTFTVDGNGNIISVTTAEGETFTVDGNGRVTSVTAKDGTTFTVDGNGRITSVRTSKGTTFTVDGKGNITGLTTASGLTFTADGKGNITSITLPTGETIDLGANVKDITWPKGTKRTFDAEAKVATYTTPEGTKFTVDAEGNITSVTTPEGETYSIDGTGVVTAVTLADGTVMPTLSLAASVMLTPLDKAAIAAWKAANRGLTLEGPPAKVGVTLGIGWQEQLKTALNTGMLKVYDGNGVEIPVTGAVLKKITAQDVAAVDADGTIHVILTPEVGSAEAVEQTGTQIETTPLTGTILEPLSSSVADKVKQVNDLSKAVEEYGRLSKEAAESGDILMGRSYSDMGAETLKVLNTEVQSLSDQDLEALGGHIASLMAALEGGEGTPEQIAQWQEELTNLLSFVETIGPDRFTSTGTNVAAGIAQGMNAYGWDGDAGTMAEAIRAAINASLGVASPATTMIPTGQYVAAGIGQGMLQYAFPETGAVQAKIIGAFAGFPSRGQTIGNAFGAGLARGLQARLPGIVAAARAAANQIAEAFRRAWQVHSPSKVAQNLTEMFGAGLERGMRDWPTVSERVLDNDIANVRRGMGAYVSNRTDSRDMSVSNAIQVAELNVRSEKDIYDVSRELYQLTRRDQRLVGGR